MESKKELIQKLISAMDINFQHSILYNIHDILEYKNTLFSKDELDTLVKIIKISLANGYLNKPIDIWQKRSSTYYAGNSPSSKYYDVFDSESFTLCDMIELCDYIIDNNLYGRFIVRNIIVCSSRDIVIPDMEYIKNICKNILISSFDQ